MKWFNCSQPSTPRRQQPGLQPQQQPQAPSSGLAPTLEEEEEEEEEPSSSRLAPSPASTVVSGGKKRFGVRSIAIVEEEEEEEDEADVVLPPTSAPLPSLDPSPGVADEDDDSDDVIMLGTPTRPISRHSSTSSLVDKKLYSKDLVPQGCASPRRVAADCSSAASATVVDIAAIAAGLKKLSQVTVKNFYPTNFRHCERACYLI